MGEDKNEHDPWRPPEPQPGGPRPPDAPTDQAPAWSPAGPPPPYPPPPTGAWYGYRQPAVPRTNGFAIASLVLGILAVFTCLPGILAVIFGHVSLYQIKRTGEQGRGMAIAGLITGYIGLAFLVIVFAIGVAGGFEESAAGPSSQGRTWTDAKVRAVR